MSNIVQLYDASNNKVYPVTHLRSVRDSSGTTLESMMQDVREIAVGYYECSTTGNTAAKTITIDSSVSLSTKILCKVKFVEKNTVNNATLNINGTGAKALYYNGVRVAANNSWYPNEVVDLYYDGTNYQAKSCADTLEYDVSLHQTHEITEITTTTRTLVFNGNVVSGWESETPVSDSSVEGYTRSETNTGQDVDSTTVDGPNATYDSTANKTNVVYVTTHTHTHVVNNYTFSEAVNAVPMSYRHGGLKLRFISNSDNNKYVQYRLMTNSFSTTVGDWQGVDNEPIENSNNLITSGGVEKKIGNVISKVGPFTITDENGYIGVVADSDGLKAKEFYAIINGELIPISNIAKYIKTSSGFYVCDESGYILFGIRNNGTVIGKLFDDFCKAIELRGTIYNVVNNKITIPNSAIQIEYAAKLSLPKKINMLQGHVYNLYYEQMLGYGFIRDYKVSATSLPFHPLYYSFLHNSTSVGNTTKTIKLWNGFGYKMEEKSLIINTVNKDTAGNLKICVIGDSMTENPKKLYELANLAANDNNFTITFLGARTATGTDSDGNTRTVKHCGYSGRNIIDVCQLASYGENKPNIFYDSTLETTNKFSIAKGIAAMGDTPDVIIIDHGANQAASSWSDVKGCYDFIINDIADYNTAHNTDIKVVICVQQPGGLIDTINVPLLGSKWGRDYAPTKLMDYVNEYDDREDEGIFLLPQYLIIDPYKDYPRTDAPYSERNTSLREIALDNVHMGINMNSHSANHVYSYGEICTDGNDNGYISLKNNNTEPLSDDKIHWAKTKDDVNAGYWKLADIYYAELKYIAGL